MVLRRRVLTAQASSAKDYEPHNKPTSRGSWSAPTLKELRDVFVSALRTAIWPPDVVTTVQYSRLLTSRVEGLTVSWQTFRVIAEAAYVLTHGLRYDNVVMQVFMAGHLTCVLLHLMRRQFWLRWREEICMGMNIMYSTVSFLKIFYLVPRLPNEDNFLFKYCLLYLADAYFCQVPVHKFYRLQFADASLRWIWWRLYDVMPGAPYVLLIATSLAWQLLLLVFSASLQAHHVSAFLRLQPHASDTTAPKGPGPSANHTIVDRDDAPPTLPASSGPVAVTAIPHAHDTPGDSSATPGHSASTAPHFRATVAPAVFNGAAAHQIDNSNRVATIDEHSRIVTYMRSLRSLVLGRSGYVLLEELRSRLASRAGPSGLTTAAAAGAERQQAPLGLLRTSVQLYITAADPRNLPSDWLARLTAVVEKGAPGWLVASASARSGSLVVHLDLVFSPMESCVSVPNPLVPSPANELDNAIKSIAAPDLDIPVVRAFHMGRSADLPEFQLGAGVDDPEVAAVGQTSPKPSEFLAQFLTMLEATDVLDMLGLPHDLPAEPNKDVISVQCEEYVKSYRAVRCFRNNVARLVDMEVMSRDGSLEKDYRQMDGPPGAEPTMALYSNGLYNTTNTAPCDDGGDKLSSAFYAPAARSTSVPEPPTDSNAEPGGPALKRIVAFGSREGSRYAGRQGRMVGNGTETPLLGTYASTGVPYMGADGKEAFARSFERTAAGGRSGVVSPVAEASEAGEFDAVQWEAFELREPLDKWLGNPWVHASSVSGLDSGGAGLGMLGSSSFTVKELPDPDDMELDSYVAAVVPGQPHKLSLHLTCCAGVVQQLQVVFRHISPSSYSSGTHLARPAKEIVHTLSSPVSTGSTDNDHKDPVKLIANLNFSAESHDMPGLVHVELWRGRRRLTARPVLLASAPAAAGGGVGTVATSAVPGAEAVVEDGHEQRHIASDNSDDNGVTWLQELDEHVRALAADQGPSVADDLVEELGGWLAQVAALARGLMQGASHPTGGLQSKKVARVLRVHCVGGAKASTEFISVSDQSPAESLEAASCCNLIPTPASATTVAVPSISASSTGALSAPLPSAESSPTVGPSRAAVLETALRDPLLSVLWRLLLVQGRMLLAVAVEGGCVRLADHINSMMTLHLSASQGEVLDGALTPVTGLPLLHAAVKSGSIQMLDMVVRWHLDAGTPATDLWLYEAVVQTGGAALGAPQSLLPNATEAEADVPHKGKEHVSVLESWQPVARASLEDFAPRPPCPAVLANALFLTTSAATSRIKVQNRDQGPIAAHSLSDCAGIAAPDASLSDFRPYVEGPPKAAMMASTKSVSSEESPFISERHEADPAPGSPAKAAPLGAVPDDGLQGMCFRAVTFKRRVKEPDVCATALDGDQAPHSLMALARTAALAPKIASSPSAPQERPKATGQSTPGDSASLAQAMGKCDDGGNSGGWSGVMSLLSTQAGLAGKAMVPTAGLKTQAEDGVLVVTPLHIMLVLGDHGRMANHIMESYPEASAVWRASQSTGTPAAATQTHEDLCMEPVTSDSLSNHCSVLSTAQLARATAYDAPSTRSGTPCSSTEEPAGAGEQLSNDADVSAATVFATSRALAANHVNCVPCFSAHRNTQDGLRGQRLRPMARKDMSRAHGSSSDLLTTVEDACVAHVETRENILVGEGWTRGFYDGDVSRGRNQGVVQRMTPC